MDPNVRSQAGDVVGFSKAAARRAASGESNEFPPTSTFLLYLTLGVLAAEAVAGGLLYVAGASLFHSAGTPTATTPTVPNGPAVHFELMAYMTGYVGVGGSIAGVRDPTITVAWGDHVTVTVVDGEAQTHNLHLDGYNLQTSNLNLVGQSSNLTFQATQEGDFAYYCTMPGHRAAGMAGLFTVGESAPGATIGPEANLTSSQIARSPTDIPPPIERNYSATVNLYLHAVEVTAEIEPGVSFNYWTYNATVPGPFFRVRVGDTVIVHFSNDANSTMNHSVDFHAVTGPGGGAAATQTPPGQTRSFQFRAMVPGLFVYHCASPDIPTHIAEGMYGMILVEPAAGLPKVDHEFYLMQGELYLQYPIHAKGAQLFNGTALEQEQPAYVVFNGAYNTFTGARHLAVRVNDSVRIFFGVGGPNLISSFHMIGGMFDYVYAAGDLTDPPLHGLQTVMVAPGSTAMTDFTAMFPGNYPLLDHAIERGIDQGAEAVLNVTGWANSSIFQKIPSDALAPAMAVGSGSAAPAVRSDPDLP